MFCDFDPSISLYISTSLFPKKYFHLEPSSSSSTFLSYTPPYFSLLPKTKNRFQLASFRDSEVEIPDFKKEKKEQNEERPTKLASSLSKKSQKRKRKINQNLKIEIPKILISVG